MSCNGTFKKSLIKTTYLFSPAVSMDIPQNLTRADTVHRCTQEIKACAEMMLWVRHRLPIVKDPCGSLLIQQKLQLFVSVCKRITAKSCFSHFSHLFFCKQYTIGLHSGLRGPAVRHAIAAVTHLSAVVLHKVVELQERVTLWPALTEGVNHVFINTL